ncbi:hypothetical protein L1049_019529 [Liquidambar formosana]|uniref:Uncharacterized protein n=1 Tax=Liquidambar formosana TaxID=63359 RepID=A0AAP0XA79_LIQFO
MSQQDVNVTKGRSEQELCGGSRSLLRALYELSDLRTALYLFVKKLIHVRSPNKQAKIKLELKVD